MSRAVRNMRTVLDAVASHNEAAALDVMRAAEQIKDAALLVVVGSRGRVFVTREFAHAGARCVFLVEPFALGVDHARWRRRFLHRHVAQQPSGQRAVRSLERDALPAFQPRSAGKGFAHRDRTRPGVNQELDRLAVDAAGHAEMAVRPARDHQLAVATLVGHITGLLTALQLVKAQVEHAHEREPEQRDAQRAADDSLDHETPLSEVFEDQIACADIVLLSKADLAGEAGLAAAKAVIDAEAPRKLPILAMTDGVIDPRVILGLGAAAEDDIYARPSHHDGEDEHEHDHHRTHEQDRAARRLLRLELPAIVHGAARARHDRVDLRLHRPHEVAEVVAVGDIRRNHGLALGVLAGDQVARALGGDVGRVW